MNSGCLFNFKNDSIMLAMKVYSSWTDRVFSQDGFEVLLMLGMIVAAIGVPLLARRRTAESPYFSGVFALALCPFLLAAVVALLHIHSLIEHEDLIIERLRFPRQVLVFGGALSLFSVASYSTIRAVIRRTQ